MKTKLLFLTTLFFIILTNRFNAQAGYTQIPDIAFERVLIASGFDLGEPDGRVSTANIKNITELNLQNLDVFNLTGIEDFTALISLNVFSTKLSAINVTYNKNLEELYISANNVSGLSTIDVTQNTRLKDLRIFDTQITTIDVSKNTQLTLLLLQGNKLSGVLDITNNTKLIELSCGNNSIDALDVSNQLDLKELSVNNNKLIEIDVSNNLKLTRFIANKNNLTYLNIKNGNNANILNFAAQENPNLRCIKVDNASYSQTNWTNVDSHIATYSPICYEGTFIADVNFENQIESIGSGNGINSDNYVDTDKIGAVKTMNVSNKNISSIAEIENFTLLEDFYASNNLISSVDISKNLNLKNVDFRNNKLTQIDVSKNVKLTSLSVGINQISTLDVTKLPELKSLFCFGNNLSAINLHNNTKLEVLNCSTNRLVTLNVDSNPLLTGLYVFSNQLNQLNVNNQTKLTYLAVGDNNLTELDISNNPKLEDLYCENNQLENLNVYSNPLLQNIYTQQNKLKYLDLQKNTVLKNLDASDNNLAGLNTKNGNYFDLFLFNTKNNPNLTCIEVDNVNYSLGEWTKIDAQTSFSTNCTPFNDDCANAIPLTFGQQTPGDVISGNADNNASCAIGTVLADVWFSIIVPNSGEFSIEGSAIGGLLKFAVYQNCQTTTPIACGTSISLTNLQIGATYFVKAWIETSGNKTQNNVAENGTFTIIANQTSVLSADNFLTSETNLLIYPNPTSNKVNLKSINSDVKQVEIYNLQGKRVLNMIDFNETMDINVANLSKGIYLIKAKTTNKTSSKKLIIN
jgi:hypothetical protein